MSKYQVGDVVRLVVDHPDGNKNMNPGDVGQIVKFLRGGRILGVDWGRPIGHNLEGALEGSHKTFGWYVGQEEVEPYFNANVQLDADMLDSLLSGGGF